jgi:two-component system NtrC family sensor kinase
MKQVFPLILLLSILLGAFPAAAQSPQTAGLKQALAQATTDTTRVLLLADISASYRYSRFDSVMSYAWRGLNLAQRIHYKKGEGRCLSRIGILVSERGNLPQALRIDLNALQLNEASHDWEGMARTLNQTGLLYHALEDYRPALAYFFRSKSIYERHHIKDDSQLISVLANLGAGYEGLGKLDSATYFLNLAWKLTTESAVVHQSPWGNPAPYVLRELGLLQATQHRPGRPCSFTGVAPWLPAPKTTCAAPAGPISTWPSCTWPGARLTRACITPAKPCAWASSCPS